MAHAAISRYVAPALLIVAAGTALTTLSNLSQAQSQPGTPSQTQPDQRDRQDRNKQDRTRDNQNQPGDRSDPNRDDPNRNDDRDGMTNEDDDFFWRDDRGNERDGVNRNGYQSPFTFLSPQSETAFSERRQRLARMEERLTERTDEMIRRLGDIRQMEPARRDDAILDLMQQVLLDQRRLMLYLRQSRSTWAGDMTDMNGTSNNPNNQQRPGSTTPARPGNNGNR